METPCSNEMIYDSLLLSNCIIIFDNKKIIITQIKSLIHKIDHLLSFENSCFFLNEMIEL